MCIIGEVKPIFKKGEKCYPGNYRPVSLTSVLCKVLEGFVRDALTIHIKEHNFLSDHQYGFCSGRSCTTQLLTTLQDRMRFIEEGKSVDVIYLDLQKAFDQVPHFINDMPDVVNYIIKIFADDTKIYEALSKL